MNSLAAAAIMETPRVLVAEHNQAHRQRVCHLLGRRGFRVRAVDNGRAAVAACVVETFDIVLMEVQMPEMDGFEAAQLIREHELAGGRRTPILALAAHAISADHSRCIAAVVDDYLIKPLKAAELFAAIERAGGKFAPHKAPAAAQACTVDLAALRARVGDDVTVARLCRRFMREATQLLGELETALAAGDMELLYRTAHRLKGALDILHVPQADARLTELKAAACAGDGLRVRAECDASRGMLAALFSQLSANQRNAAA